MMIDHFAKSSSSLMRISPAQPMPIDRSQSLSVSSYADSAARRTVKGSGELFAHTGYQSLERGLPVRPRAVDVPLNLGLVLFFLLDLRPQARNFELPLFILLDNTRVRRHVQVELCAHIIQLSFQLSLPVGLKALRE